MESVIQFVVRLPANCVALCVVQSDCEYCGMRMMVELLVMECYPTDTTGRVPVMRNHVVKMVISCDGGDVAAKSERFHTHPKHTRSYENRPSCPPKSCCSGGG